MEEERKDALEVEEEEAKTPQESAEEKSGRALTAFSLQAKLIVSLYAGMHPCVIGEEENDQKAAKV